MSSLLIQRNGMIVRGMVRSLYVKSAAAPPANAGWALSPSMRQQVRHKTFRKTPTRAFLRRKEHIKQLRAKGEPLPVGEYPVLENKFWKVVGGMKVYKGGAGLSPGQTNRRHATRFHLHKGGPLSRLSRGHRSTGGRDSTGRISVRHRGGGHKRRSRTVDFVRSTPGRASVVRLEYDPGRSAELALLRHAATNEFSYILRPAGLNPGDTVDSFRNARPLANSASDLPRAALVAPGNCLRLRDIPVGSRIHCISLTADGPARLCRSAGASAQLLYTAHEGFAQVRLTSSEVRLIPVDACATIGSVGNEMHMHRNWGKAGARRHKGWRPAVRGIAMSAHAHPHGGGHKSKGNKQPRSIWGWLTKGYKTVRRKRWFVVTPKWKARKSN